jgi:hypothetical protein
MLLAYIDESYDRDEYWLTALVVPNAVALQLQNKFDDIVRDATLEFGVPLTAELHGHPLLHAKEAWEPMKEPVRARINIYQAALRAIADTEGTQIVMAGIDVARLNRRYTAPPHPHQEALDQLAQSVNALAAECETDFLAIADEIDQSDTLRASYWDMQRLDTISRYGGKLERAVDALHFAPSRHSRLLQAADLVSYLHFRIRRTPDADPRSAKASARLWNIVDHQVKKKTIWP